MALHTGAGRSVAKALKDSIDYMENPLKTDNGELISSYECDAKTADNEFLLAKQRYAMLTGRDQGKRDVIAYQHNSNLVSTLPKRRCFTSSQISFVLDKTGVRRL